MEYRFCIWSWLYDKGQLSFFECKTGDILYRLDCLIKATYHSLISLNFNEKRPVTFHGNLAFIHVQNKTKEYFEILYFILKSLKQIFGKYKCNYQVSFSKWNESVTTVGWALSITLTGFKWDFFFSKYVRFLWTFYTFISRFPDTFPSKMAHYTTGWSRIKGHAKSSWFLSNLLS